MAESTWPELTAGLDERDLELISAYRAMAAPLPDTTERISRTEIAFFVSRGFTSGFLKNHYLEIAVHLLRRAEHPLLREAFPTTRRVITHRLTLSTLADLGSVRDLITEAHDTVGPGTR